MPTSRAVRSPGRAVLGLLLLAIIDAFSTIGCSGWMVISTCRVQGTVEAADKSKGAPCTGRLSGEHPSEAQPVGVTGDTFTYAMAVAGSGAPAMRGHIVLACEGFEDSTALSFEVRPGRFRCEAAQLGTVIVTRRQDTR
jgi:hypothetical protein